MPPQELWHHLSDYTVVIEKQMTDDGHTVYFATVAELLGCSSDGTTLEEARANLDDAYALYSSTAFVDGDAP